MQYTYIVVTCHFHTDVLDDGIIRNLIYFNPVFEAHQDAYRCVAKNIVGSVHQVFNTIVDGN